MLHQVELQQVGDDGEIKLEESAMVPQPLAVSQKLHVPRLYC